MAHTIYEELSKAARVTIDDGEDIEAFIQRLAVSVDKLRDDDWKLLSEEAKEWANDAILLSDFIKYISDIQKRDKCSESEAIEKARSEHPDEARAFDAREEIIARLGLKTNGGDEPAATRKKDSPRGRKPRKTATVKSAARQRKAPTTDRKAAGGMRGKWAALLAAAQEGKVPPPPDFSAPTHKSWRKRLAEVVSLVQAKDVRGLKKYNIKLTGSSSRIIDRYRNLAIIAFEAQK